MRLGLLLGALLTGVGTAEVPAANRLFKSVDGDGDGKVSRKEFPAGDELFSRLDANHDGFIDAGEAQIAERLWRVRQAAGGAISSVAARAAAPLPSDVELQSDIVYKTVAGKSVALDLYRLKGKTYSQAPLLIFIHGGGYVGGDKQGILRRNADVFGPLLREHGYLVASVNYRLCTSLGAKLLDCSTDCKDAVRFLAKHSSKYGIDARRTAAMGASAGGSLALLLPLTKDDDLRGDAELAKQPSHVTCAVSWFGCTDFSQLDLVKEFHAQKVSQRMPVLFTSASDKILRECELVSPAWYLKRDAAKVPLLLVHGENDATVPLSQSTWLDGEARKLGAPVTLVVVKKAGHGFKDAPGPISPARDEINRRTREFVLEHNK